MANGLEQVQEILKRYREEFEVRNNEPCCIPPKLCPDCARIKAEDELGYGGHKSRGR